jgi:hypothetical protein
MKANRNYEDVYELLEQFDFNELSDKDRNYVLSIMTRDEYISLRSTLKDTKTLYSNSPEIALDNSIYNSLINKSNKKNIIIKILMHPVKLYQVAALIILIFGIYAIIQYSVLPEKNKPLAVIDTIYLHKTDTVYSKLIDTVRIIKEKIVYVSKDKSINNPPKLLSITKYKFDCNKEICPNDIDRIKELTFNNNISIDTLFND